MKKRRWFLVFAILTGLLMTAVTAVAEQGGEDISSRASKADIRLSITREYQLRKEADANLEMWDECMNEQKQAGLSDAISKDLQKRGMKFVGSTIIYSYLQAIGVIYSHDSECFMYMEIPQ